MTLSYCPRKMESWIITGQHSSISVIFLKGGFLKFLEWFVYCFVIPEHIHYSLLCRAIVFNFFNLGEEETPLCGLILSPWAVQVWSSLITSPQPEERYSRRLQMPTIHNTMSDLFRFTSALIWWRTCIVHAFLYPAAFWCLQCGLPVWIMASTLFWFSSTLLAISVACLHSSSHITHINCLFTIHTSEPIVDIENCISFFGRALDNLLFICPCGTPTIIQIMLAIQ